MQRGKRPGSLLRRAAAFAVAIPLLAGCSSSSGNDGPGSIPAGARGGGATAGGSGAPAAAAATPPDTAPPSGTPSWTPVTPSSTGPRAGAVLELTGTHVGPVAIGADGRDAETALVELLGVPDRTTDGAGCSLLTPVPRERALFWGDFHVLMTAGTVSEPRVALTGWSVIGSATPVPARLPYAVAVGRSTGSDVRHADPTVRTGDSLGAGIVLTDRAGVQFILSGLQPASPVVQVVYGISACE